MLKKRGLFRSTAVGVLALLAITGCASYGMPARAAYHPAKPMVQQDADHNECWAFAKARTGYDPTTAGGGGALTTGLLMGAAGAALGAIVGSTQGRTGTGAAIGAGVGGIGGAVAGGMSELDRMHQLFTKQYSVCMRAKGYVVE